MRVPGDAAPLRDRQLQRQQRERRGIVERGRDVADRNAVEADLHVLDRVHGHAAGAEDLGRHLVGVVAAVDRVAGDQRDGRAAVRQDGLEPRVVVLRHAEPDQLALRPGAAAMHGGIDAARHRQLAGEAQRLHVALVAAPPASPRACRSASPRCRSGSAGWPCSPSPACTSARQRPRASPKSDSGSGTALWRHRDFARLPMRHCSIAVPSPPHCKIALPPNASNASQRPCRYTPKPARRAALSVPRVGVRQRGTDGGLSSSRRKTTQGVVNLIRSIEGALVQELRGFG